MEGLQGMSVWFNLLSLDHSVTMIFISIYSENVLLPVQLQIITKTINDLSKGLIEIKWNEITIKLHFLSLYIICK